MRKCKVCDNSLSDKQKKYCSVECQHKGYRQLKVKRIERKCLYCKNIFYIKPNDIKYGRGKYCSRKCNDLHKKETYKGEKNPLYGVELSQERKKQNSKMMKKLWKTEEWRKKYILGIERFIAENGYYPGTDEESKEKRKKTMLEKYGVEHNWNGKYGERKCDINHIKKYGKSSLENMNDILYTTYQTIPEKKIENILQKNNIKYKKQYKIIYDDELLKYKVYDFFLEKINILIEADGDYWHGNKKFFKKLNKTQLNNIKNDNFKNNLAVENGFKLLRFWEYDINKDDFEDKLLENICQKNIE